VIRPNPGPAACPEVVVRERLIGKPAGNRQIQAGCEVACPSADRRRLASALLFTPPRTALHAAAARLPSPPATVAAPASATLFAPPPTKAQQFTAVLWASPAIADPSPATLPSPPPIVPKSPVILLGARAVHRQRSWRRSRLLPPYSLRTPARCCRSPMLANTPNHCLQRERQSDPFLPRTRRAWHAMRVRQVVHTSVRRCVHCDPPSWRPSGRSLCPGGGRHLPGARVYGIMPVYVVDCEDGVHVGEAPQPARSTAPPACRRKRLAGFHQHPQWPRSAERPRVPAGFSRFGALERTRGAAPIRSAWPRVADLVGTSCWSGPRVSGGNSSAREPLPIVHGCGAGTVSATGCFARPQCSLDGGTTARPDIPFGKPACRWMGRRPDPPKYLPQPDFIGGRLTHLTRARQDWNVFRRSMRLALSGLQPQSPAAMVFHG
jgi:hypothetical protein